MVCPTGQVVSSMSMVCPTGQVINTKLDWPFILLTTCFFLRHVFEYCRKVRGWAVSFCFLLFVLSKLLKSVLLCCLYIGI